jgi:hypothetical protein
LDQMIRPLGLILTVKFYGTLVLVVHTNIPCLKGMSSFVYI